jgi:hypothetical protein
MEAFSSSRRYDILLSEPHGLHNPEGTTSM